MDVRLVTEQGVEDRSPEELTSLLRRETGLVWVDIPCCDVDGARVLSEVFGSIPWRFGTALSVIVCRRCTATETTC